MHKFEKAFLFKELVCIMKYFNGYFYCIVVLCKYKSILFEMARVKSDSIKLHYELYSLNVLSLKNVLFILNKQVFHFSAFRLKLEHEY